MHALAMIRHLARNNAWSSQRLHRACAALSAEDYRATRTSFFPSIHLTLTHILLVDWFYLDALESGGRGLDVFANMEPFAALAELSEAQRAADARLLALVDALPDASALDREVAVPRRDGPHIDRAGDVLLHLFIHQIHHRGQVHAMLSGTPVAPPPLDEYFLAEDRVQADKELAAAGLGTI